MSATSSPYGLQPISSVTGDVRPMRIPLGVSSGYSANIFKYQPVRINPTTGTLNACAAGQSIFGVFSGIEYTPIGGRPIVSPFWAAGTVFDPTYDMFAYIWPAWNEDVRWLIQADGPVTATQLGRGFALNNAAAGSTSTGLSACTVAAAGVGAGNQSTFNLVEFSTAITSAVGDAYTDLIVQIAFSQVGPSSSVSIG